jgi:DNA replication protein DnaC
METITQNGKCPKCGGTGMFIFEQKASEYAKANDLPHIYGEKDPYIWVSRKCPVCNGGREEVVKTLNKISNIPRAHSTDRYSSFKWDAYKDDRGNVIDTSKHQKVVDTYLEKFQMFDDEGMGLYIWSETKGTGKTMLSSCICNELMTKYQIGTRYVRTADLLDIANSADKNSYDEDKRDPLKLLRECRVLVLDDIGQRKTGNEWLQDILFQILDARTFNKLVTIFTSNVKVQNLTIDERVRRRIEDFTVQLSLPEYPVGNSEAKEKKMDLLKKAGFYDGD